MTTKEPRNAQPRNTRNTGNRPGAPGDDLPAVTMRRAPARWSFVRVRKATAGALPWRRRSRSAPGSRRREASTGGVEIRRAPDADSPRASHQLSQSVRTAGGTAGELQRANPPARVEANRRVTAHATRVKAHFSRSAWRASVCLLVRGAVRWRLCGSCLSCVFRLLRSFRVSCVSWLCVFVVVTRFTPGPSPPPTPPRTPRQSGRSSVCPTPRRAVPSPGIA